MILRSIVRCSLAAHWKRLSTSGRRERRPRESNRSNVKLRSVLRRRLAGWRDDLPASWRAAVEGVELDFEHRTFDGGAHRGEIIVPGRKEFLVPESPHGAHIFRAFDGINPESARAVILEQDPHPKRSWATGRAFEQGNLYEWPESRQLIADSLRRIVQALVYARTRTDAYVRNGAGWRAWWCATGSKAHWISSLRVDSSIISKAKACCCLMPV